jgi:hypothetical protein
MRQANHSATERDDFRRVDVDYLKHVSTLSAGSVIVLIVFLQKLIATNARWTPLVAVAVAGLIVSVIATVIAHTAVATNQTRRSPVFGRARLLWIAGATVMWGGFLAGVTALATSAV